MVLLSASAAAALASSSRSDGRAGSDVNGLGGFATTPALRLTDAAAALMGAAAAAPDELVEVVDVVDVTAPTKEPATLDDAERL